MRYNDLTTTSAIFKPAILSMLNCEWIIYPREKEGRGPKAYKWDNRKLNNSYSRYFGSLQSPLCNAWFIKNIYFVKNADEEYNEILARNFKPSETVYIDDRYRDLIPVDTFLNYKKDKAPILDYKSYQPNKLVYNFTSPTQHDQLAVFSEIYYEKGWNAYIDGKLTPHFRVNYILRGLMVPKGTKEIVFEFRPKSYEIGEKVALASSILLLLLLAFISYKEIRRV